MGTWGAGNFQDDTAAEHLVTVVRPLLRQIEETVADDESMTPDEYESVAMMANLEIIACLAEHLGTDTHPTLSLPAAATIEGWKVSYLRVWDAYIDELNPKPDFRRHRRQVIEATFDRVIQAAARERA